MPDTPPQDDAHDALAKEIGRAMHENMKHHSANPDAYDQTVFERSMRGYGNKNIKPFKKKNTQIVPPKP